MIWAAHNPEAYEELERNAAVTWLSRYAGVHSNTMALLVELLQHEEPEVFKAIMDAGAYKLVDESEYFDKFVR